MENKNTKGTSAAKETDASELLEKQKAFYDIYFANIKREGAEELFAWLLKSGFFEAPVSDRGYGAKKGALVERAVDTYRFLADANMRLKTPYSDESIAIVGLLGDIYLTNAFRETTKKRKTEDGKWETVPAYEKVNNFLVGAGEKSVIMLQSFFRSQFVPVKGENAVKSGMTNDEIMAIRWHLGESDPLIRNGVYSLDEIFRQSKLAYLAAKAASDVRYIRFLV